MPLAAHPDSQPVRPWCAHCRLCRVTPDKIVGSSVRMATMSPAEQVFILMQHLPADQQQSVLHFVQSLNSPPKLTPQINQSLLSDIEQRVESKRAQREVWGDDDM